MMALDAGKEGETISILVHGRYINGNSLDGEYVIWIFVGSEWGLERQ